MAAVCWQGRKWRGVRPCGWLNCHAQGRVSLRGLEVDHQARRIGEGEGTQTCSAAQAQAPRQVTLEVLDDLGLAENLEIGVPYVCRTVVGTRGGCRVDLHQRAGNAAQGDRLAAGAALNTGFAWRLTV